MIARRSHPAIRQAQREVTVADLNARIAERGNNPTVSMTVTRSTNDQQVDDLTAGLVLRQRLYNGGATASAERRAMAQRDANRASLHQTVLSVERSVGSAWSQVQIVAAQIQALDRQIEAARIAFEGTREEARLGARTTLDVLDAEQELLTARASRIDAVNNRYVAIYSLLSAMGLLTVEHLNLGITTYDPAAYYNAVKRAPAGLSAQGRRLDRVLESIGRQ